MDDAKICRSGVSDFADSSVRLNFHAIVSCIAACLPLIALLAMPNTSHAHHSFAATYYMDRTVTLKGKVVQFMYRNPHTLLQIVVTGADGKSVRWAVEWAATLALSESGVARDAIKPGDEVVVVGHPPRNPVDPRVRLKTIERPKDGWRWGEKFS